MTKKVTVEFICDNCGTTGAARYYLRQYGYKRGTGTKNPSVGGTDLCAACVTKIVSRPPRKRRALEVAA